MKHCGLTHQGNILRVFYSLPFHYGYSFMMSASTIMVSNIYNGNLSSFRVGGLAGMRLYDYTLYVKLHRLQIEKCRLLKKEHGVLCIRGKTTCDTQPVEIELTMLNQTDIIRLSIMPGNECYLQYLDSIIDTLVNETQPLT